MDKQELKNCPSCEGLAGIIKGNPINSSIDFFKCYCTNCQLRQHYKYPDAQTAITIWNTRPEEDRLNARIKELEAEHKAVNNWFYNTLMPREDICIPALILEELDNILSKGNKNG